MRICCLMSSGCYLQSLRLVAQVVCEIWGLLVCVVNG